MKIFKSFKYAIKGIIYTIKNERHMRIHSVAMLFVIVLSFFFDLSPERYAILFLTIALVIVSEIINSSIESVIDVFAKDYNSIAKAAKDMAAGAVLIAAIFSVIVGGILFSSAQGYIKMFKLFCSCPIAPIIAALLVAFSYFYVFWGPTEIKNHIKKIFK